VDGLPPAQPFETNFRKARIPFFTDEAVAIARDAFGVRGTAEELPG